MLPPWATLSQLLLGYFSQGHVWPRSRFVRDWETTCMQNSNSPTPPAPCASTALSKHRDLV